MRYADQPAVHSETHVKAPPEEVWGFVTDITLPAELSDELQRVEWLDGATEPAVGARFLGHNHHPAAGDWQTVSEVVELRPARRFGWAVLPVSAADAPGVDPARTMATWWFDLEPRDGGTLLRQSMRIGPGRSGLSRMIDRHPDREEEVLRDRLDQLRTGMETTLRAIRDRAEADRTAP